MEVSKKDWKLFRACIGEWQEAYMERLTKEYIDLLSGDENASDKFWKLEERIKKDKKHPGVMLELSKENMIFDIVTLINRDVITVVDLKDFSDELKEYVNSLSNPEIKEVAEIFEDDEHERDPLELLAAPKLFDYMKYANGTVDIDFSL